MTTIHFTRSKQSVSITAGQHRLSDVCETAGIALKTGCLQGNCGSCRVRISSGRENCKDKNANEKRLTDDDDERLACQCIISGDIDIDL